MRVVIMSGISGSGKSTLLKQWSSKYKSDFDIQNMTIISADNYWTKNGSYNFDQNLIGQAHQECFRSYLEACKRKAKLIVVDNTNTTNEEIAPYYLAGESFGYEVRIITMMCVSWEDVLMCQKRNTHGVSMISLLNQYNNLIQRKLLPWWRNDTVYVKGN